MKIIIIIVSTFLFIGCNTAMKIDRSTASSSASFYKCDNFVTTDGNSGPLDKPLLAKAYLNLTICPSLLSISTDNMPNNISMGIMTLKAIMKDGSCAYEFERPNYLLICKKSK